jgi:exopolyphosphatase/guanosine-5'-triphosphate,3'-diphosphate pyrophosphatase
MTRLAAVDLGSNSFHLLVADELAAGRLRRVTTCKLTLRLAEPVARTGKLGRDGRQRAVAAFADLIRQARRAGAQQVVAVATEALRQASDGARLREEFAAVHPVPVRLLDGLEEAFLSLRGMVGALHPPPGEGVLGLDLGGGSYEVAYGSAAGMLAGASLPLGSARVSVRSQHDPPRLAERVALHEETRALLEPLAEKVAAMHHRGGPPRAVGTAGTIRDLGRLGLTLAGGVTPERIRGLVVTRTQLELGYARLVSFPLIERLELPGVGPKRADLLPFGGVVVLATLQVFGLEQLQLSDWGLREGVLLDALSEQQIITRDALAPLAG